MSRTIQLLAPGGGGLRCSGDATKASTVLYARAETTLKQLAADIVEADLKRYGG